MNDSRTIEGLAALPVVTVGGVEYTGSYLALLVAINPELLAAEVCRTPQLVFELGRIVAHAYREKSDAEADYRAWRDSLTHKLTNGLKAASKVGFECACSPGVDAKGKPKQPKTPSVTAVETYIRGLAEYRRYYTRIADREEAWSTLHAALEAAKTRTWAMRNEFGGAGDDNQSNRRIVADFSDPAPIDVGESRNRRPPPPPRRK